MDSIVREELEILLKNSTPENKKFFIRMMNALIKCYTKISKDSQLDSYKYEAQARELDLLVLAMKIEKEGDKDESTQP